MTQLLDHGFVTLVERMSDEKAITDAARISYSNDRQVRTGDATLLRYLMRNAHWTPFEMPMMRFHVKCPIFVARQWMRHRSGAFNEMSARYTDMKDEFYVPAEDQLLTQSTDNKQGRSGQKAKVDPQVLQGVHDHAYEVYEEATSLGLARELARGVLPVNLYTQFYWQVNLRNLLHFLELRLHPHAQYEIRVYAEAIAEMVKEHYPNVWQAFKDYHLDAVTFTGPELEFLKVTATESDVRDSTLTKREQDEFLAKVSSLTHHNS